jgi:hypothetical protein
LLVGLLLRRVEMWQRVDLLRPDHGHSSVGGHDWFCDVMSEVAIEV